VELQRGNISETWTTSSTSTQEGKRKHKNVEDPKANKRKKGNQKKKRKRHWGARIEQLSNSAQQRLTLPLLRAVCVAACCVSRGGEQMNV